MADEAGNITPLIEPGLTFVNRSDASQVLADGHRIQYRGLPQVNDKISLLMKTVSGDPDAYLWAPRNAFWPIMGALFGAGPELPYEAPT